MGNEVYPTNCEKYDPLSQYDNVILKKKIGFPLKFPYLLSHPHVNSLFPPIFPILVGLHIVTMSIL